MGLLSTATAATLALAAFAANSILCREALRSGDIDPASFTGVRLASGALVLDLIVRTAGRPGRTAARPWAGALALLAYAAAFSFAYLGISAGLGALVLFGATQVTMIGAGLRRGDRPLAAEWIGLVLALSGLAVLASPGREAPPLGAVGLMAVAGAAWGVYSLLGRGSADPIQANATAFLRATLAATLLFVLPGAGSQFTTRGIGLAVLSGAVTSGLGYCLWYEALPHLSRTRAALLQLTVPVLAALAGVVVLGETLTGRMMSAGVLTLGGVGLAVVGAGRSERNARSSLR